MLEKLHKLKIFYMLKRIISPLVFLSFLFFTYNYNNEASSRLSWQTAVIFCVVLLILALFPEKTLTSTSTVITLLLVLSSAILGAIVFKEAILIASSIALSLAFAFILVKKYNQHSLTFFFRQPGKGRREKAN